MIIAALQQITNDWRENRRTDFDLYTLQFVIRESGAGDAKLAAKRLDKLEGIPLLAVSREALDLARRLVEKGPLPEKAEVDALHISVAASSGMDYLLT